ncbi:TMV resistance protein N [Quillaja saponaria]|uniref:TMV resistance protein N n=1 Tax=Quillaja saponaria TaxID=32244 RepID=A0AAD7L317_QUISA|nr:TMV resistance protein N [Quillaja saponaria]
MASPSSSSSSSSLQKHEIYISVQNDDPHKSVPDMIGKALTIHGIPNFNDVKELRLRQKGVDIKRELREAIGMSRMSIVFLSKNYVCSTWCLEELVVILECRRKWGLIVLPIFYDLDPSDIRKLRGDAFKIVNAQNKELMWWKRWKSALKVAANLCGWDNRNARHQSLSLFVGEVSEAIKDRKIHTNLSISIYPLRYDTCDQYLSLFLQIGMDDVLIVGLCGPSNMGKTVIASSIYEQIFFTFEGSCFLSNVGQNSRQPNGLVKLQEKLLSDILLDSDIKVRNVFRGVDMIEEKLSSKRVLVVLDDVDDMDQLYALVGKRNWFGVGSKIIITTRKLYLLKLVQADQVFLAQGLPLPQNIESIWKQFQLSRRVIAGLKEYIDSLHQSTVKEEGYLERCLLEERQKNVTQVIADLKQAHQRVSGLIEPNRRLIHMQQGPKGNNGGLV